MTDQALQLPSAVLVGPGRSLHGHLADVVVDFIQVLTRFDVGQADVYPRHEEVHDVLDLLEVPADPPQLSGPVAGAGGEDVDHLLQVDTGHVREYQHLLAFVLQLELSEQVTGGEQYDGGNGGGVPLAADQQDLTSQSGRVARQSSQQSGELSLTVAIPTPVSSI